jgi:hypothetical protein
MPSTLPRSFAALSALALVALSTGARAQSCSDEPTLRSDRPGAESEITFLNPSDEARRIFWLDPSGQRTFYGVVEPGNAHVQVTAAGHTWVVTDDLDACLLVVTAEPEPLSVDIALTAPPPAVVVTPPPPGVQQRIGQGPAGSTVTLESTAPPPEPVVPPSPVELYKLSGYYRLVPANDEGKAFNNQSNGRPEIVRVRPDWDSGQWRFEEVAGTEFVRVRNRWRGPYLRDDDGRVRVGPAPEDDEAAHWELEPVDGMPYMQLVNRASGRTLVSRAGEGELDEDPSPPRAGYWQLEPVGESQSLVAVVTPPAPRPRNVESERAYEEALDHCRSLGGFWTGASCRFPRVSRIPDCGRGWAWAEDVGECVWDRSDYREVCPPWMSGRPPFCEREMSCRGGTLRISSRGHASCDCPPGTAIWGAYPDFRCVGSYASLPPAALVAIPVVGAIAGILAYDQWRKADRRRRDQRPGAFPSTAAAPALSPSLDQIDLGKTYGGFSSTTLDPRERERLKTLFLDPTLSREVRAGLRKLSQGGTEKLTPAEAAATHAFLLTDPVLSRRLERHRVGLTERQKAGLADLERQHLGDSLRRSPAEQAADLKAVADGSYVEKVLKGNFTPTTPAEQEAALVHKRALAKAELGRTDFSPAERKLLNDLSRTKTAATGTAGGAGGGATTGGAGVAAPQRVCREGESTTTRCVCAAPMAVTAGAICATRTAAPTTTAAPTSQPCAAWQTGTPGRCVDIAYTCEGGTKVGAGKCSCPVGTRATSTGGLNIKCEAVAAAAGGVGGQRTICLGGRVTAAGCECPAGTRREGTAPSFRCALLGPAAGAGAGTDAAAKAKADAAAAKAKADADAAARAKAASDAAAAAKAKADADAAARAKAASDAAAAAKAKADADAAARAKAASDAAAAAKAKADADAAARAKAASDAAAAAKAKADADAAARAKAAADAQRAAAEKAAADARAKAAADAARQRAAAEAARAKAEADAKARAAAEQARQKAALEAARLKAEADARARAAAQQKPNQTPQCPQGQRWINGACRPG